MRIRTAFLPAFLFLGVLGLLAAQTPTPPKPGEKPKDAATDAELDAITKQTAAMEADLAKLSNTSREAADLMVKLIDTYYAAGRPFGMVRHAQLFVGVHTTHPKHRDVMLKLIDGLQVTGRSKELVATGRQFLSRNPTDPACAEIERWLPTLLRRENDLIGTATVQEAHWKRLGASVEGQRSGRDALALYLALNNAETLAKAAALGEELLDKLPAGGPATNAGWAAVDANEKLSNWAKANLVATKLLQKSPPTDPYYLRALHARMGENYSRLNQRTASADSFRKAFDVPNPPGHPLRHDLLGRVISETHAGGAKPPQLEPLVTEYYTKFPTRTDRFAYRSLVGSAYLAAMDKAKAEAIFAEVLPFDARSNNTIGNYLALMGGDPKPEVNKARYAQAEQVIRNAMAASAANPANVAALKYELATAVYRDRMADVPKAIALAREFVTVNPPNDGYTAAAVNWLFDITKTDAELQAEVAQVVAAAKKYPWNTTLRTTLNAWGTPKLAVKEWVTRAKFAQAESAKLLADPIIKEWVAFETANAANTWSPQAAAARLKLLDPARVAAYPDDLAYNLLYQQQYFYRHYAAGAEQLKSVATAKAWTVRLPKSQEAAYAFVYNAGDLVQQAAYREALTASLKCEPTSVNTDWYRRMMTMVQTLKDVELAKQTWAWMKANYVKFGYDPTYASTTGDVFLGLNMKAEAEECWQMSVKFGTEHGDYQASALRLLAQLMPADYAKKTEAEQKAVDAARLKYLDELLAKDSWANYSFAVAKADLLFKAGNIDGMVALLPPVVEKIRDRAFTNVDFTQEWSTIASWVGTIRADMKATPEAKRKVFTLVKDLNVTRASFLGYAALMELDEEVYAKTPMVRLLKLNEVARGTLGDAHDFGQMGGYIQAAMARKDYMGAATLAGGMLANSPGLDEGNRKVGRDLLTQAYSRLGAAGGAVIDEKSPIAPLLQAALQLRLGDPKLAFETYLANQKLFDEHRAEVPVDLILFVCDNHMAAGGDDNHNRVDDVLRAWLIKNIEVKEIDDTEKARIQLMLARNYFRSKRYDLARAEYTTVLNRFAKTPQAVDAEFGIGETFMEQKVYDQADQAFEKLASRRERDVVIRAEFLRGVLANRRGDRDEARLIFRGVLERVPNIELANQALYNLSEVYGAEQRYMDQLELLRTVGRLGRASKRWHTPGDPLSIVVQDSDLGVSRGHSRIPVKVTTLPGGDEETIYLLSGGAGKGLFRADLETRLGAAAKNDRTLQLTGKDVIKVDYPDEFKKEFKDAPLPDAEIRIAADSKLDVASSKVIDEDEETFSTKLAREARGNEEDDDKRKGLLRPKDQVKPGNVVYLRVKDADRDVSDQPDTIAVKLTAASGDQVQVLMKETGPHTGIFEGTAKTGELPAGALATNTAIDHSPLMAIDKDKKSAWVSEPDGAAPKTLTVDMKDLKHTDNVKVWTPDGKQYAPIRMTLEGSDDGRVWFRLASTAADAPALPVAFASGPMATRIYEATDATGFTTWDQVVTLSKNGKAASETKTDAMLWQRPPTDKPQANRPVTAIWHGKVVQAKAGAVRFFFSADNSAMLVDGRLELPLGRGARTADVYLTAGTHDITCFAAASAQQQALEVRWIRGDSTDQFVTPISFRSSDFDLARPEAKPATPRTLGTGAIDKEGTSWEFKFPAIDLRHVRMVIHEYRGEAVAINHVEIADTEGKKVHIPTEGDLLSLATNDILEIGGGDVVVATYIDDVNTTGASRLMTAKLTATYHNANITPIAYDFVKQPNGEVVNLRKDLLRIEPGERIIVEVTDYDQDQTAGIDKIKVMVAINDGKPVELEAVETLENSGIFTKEVDTSATPAEGKLAVKTGDRVFIRYLDAQNTVPGHGTVRESVIYVNEPTPGRVRIIESRATRVASTTPGVPETVQLRYLTQEQAADGQAAKTVGVAFEAPFTVEVIDRDAAKDGRSTVIVTLTTTAGAQVEVECMLNDRRLGNAYQYDRPGTALEEGRFTGQVIMQLGGKDSPSLVPLTSSMPRDLIGGPKLPKEEGENQARDRALITRVLNLTGADTVEAVYVDAKRPGGKDGEKLIASARLLTDGRLFCTDAEYLKDITAVHVGERLFLKVVDADLDRTPERDKAKIRIRSKRGEEETVELVETLSHSGMFTGSVLLKPVEKPTAGNINPDVPEIECYFGDALEIAYIDEQASSSEGKFETLLNVSVVIGTDGRLQAFSRMFSDELLAVETQFHIAESHFELFKSHKAIGREDEAKDDLEAGKRVLREVMEDYPNPKYTPRIAYLLGQFAQELKQYGEAVQAYQLIVKQYPDHQLAPDAQFKLAQCYEEANEFNQALEAYVTLAATYPKHPLIAHVMVRISEHFYKGENFKIAAQVGEKFLEKFSDHKWGPKMAFRIGQCYFKDKQYVKAAEAFDKFAKQYREDALTSDAMFWSGESYRTGGNMKKAFESYNKCRWDHPASEAAKYARGRLALPEMLRQFEEASNLENNK